MIRRAFLAASLLFAAGLCLADDPRPTLAHYMPWFSTKAVSGSWGWHWTMNRYDPEKFRWEGQREIAAHDYPLIGPYDSADPDTLECHVLLMKVAGIDGVIVDWYGLGTDNDYPLIHSNVEKLIPWLKKAGLKFAVCYEDQALKSLKDGADAAQARQDMDWLAGHWFADESYLRRENRPVLLVFGPQHLPGRPPAKEGTLIYGLPHLAESHGLDGSFAWPPVAGGKALPHDRWTSELDSMQARPDSAFSVAFPGFQDIYAQAGVHPSHGSIAAENGRTFAATLERAGKTHAPFLQIATWNDHGEGTAIEPTRSQGYRHLEKLVGLTKKTTVADLRLPVALYQLRKRGGDRPALDRAASLLFSGQNPAADALLADVSKALGQKPAVFAETPDRPDPDYRLTTDLPYRESGEITPAMRQRCRLDVYVPANVPKYPTVLWFHGGGITAGERSIPLALRQQGIGIVAANYRLAPDAKSPDFIEDAAAAIAWTMRHIGEFGGDPARLFVSGHSAGAYLSLMVGLDKKWLAALGQDADRLAGLIPLSPQAITHFTVRAERGIGQKQPVIDEMAPLFHVRGDAPPILLVTGDREKELVGRYEENSYLWRLLKLCGHPNVSLHEMTGFDHGGMPPPAFPLLLDFVRTAGPAKASTPHR